jgi:two-component system KDP operon response regulator KdpE
LKHEIHNLKAVQGAPAVLFIEGDPEIRQSLRRILCEEHYGFYEAVTGDQAVALAASGCLDLILLDLDSPGINGIEIIQRIRLRTQVPILVLSAQTDEHHKVEALDVGADDYLNKPFAPGEFLARVRAALRRSAVLDNKGPASIMAFGNIRVDIAARRVTVGRTAVHLTPIEFKLFQVLLRHAGEVLSQQQLLAEVWGPERFDPQNVRVHMVQLRRKLETDPSNPRHFITEPRIGYRLVMG